MNTMEQGMKLVAPDGQGRECEFFSFFELLINNRFALLLGDFGNETKVL